MKLPDHLGGHLNKTHIDTGALSYLLDTFDAKSFLDIGCGPGDMVHLAEQWGVTSIGIDGDFTLDRGVSTNFILHDFTEDRLDLDTIFDIGWSCEFLEHVYEKYIPNFAPCFQKCRVLAVTYAPPGWPGHHHVNLQEEDYWIDKLAEYNLIYSKEFTDYLRISSTMNLDNPKKAFVKNRGLIFINNNI